MTNESKGKALAAGVECTVQLDTAGAKDRARQAYERIKTAMHKLHGIPMSQEPWRLGASEMSQAVYAVLLALELELQRERTS